MGIGVPGFWPADTNEAAVNVCVHFWKEEKNNNHQDNKTQASWKPTKVDDYIQQIKI